MPSCISLIRFTQQGIETTESDVVPHMPRVAMRSLGHGR
jgi:hypothetical protein